MSIVQCSGAFARARRLPFAPWASIAALGFLMASCGSSGVNSRTDPRLRDEGARVFAAAPGDPGSRGGAGAGGWTILLRTFSGPDADAAADAALAFVRGEMGMAEAHLERRKSGVALAYGRYGGPSDPRFRPDLDRIRAVQMNGRPIFAQAFLAPQDIPNRPGSIPELDLLRAKDFYGPTAQATLQVAVYESDRPAEARAKAEEAALALRSEGELAFYYHGPRRSMVTIGVFSVAEVSAQDGSVSPELEALRMRRPHNLYNGRAIRESVKGAPAEQARLQPSQVVQIP